MTETARTIDDIMVPTQAMIVEGKRHYPVEKEFLFVAFGTRTRDHKLNELGRNTSKKRLAAPWEIYAVVDVEVPEAWYGNAVAKDPFYKVVGEEGGVPLLEKVRRGTAEYLKMKKWIGEATRSDYEEFHRSGMKIVHTPSSRYLLNSCRNMGNKNLPSALVSKDQALKYLGANYLLQAGMDHDKKQMKDAGK